MGVVIKTYNISSELMNNKYSKAKRYINKHTEMS